MKKLLALVLALVMTMSLVTISNAAFKDADSIDYKEAVDVMNAVGVFIGDENGNFNAKANLTREQAAKILAYLELGDKAADALVGGATFTDVAADRWSAGFVGFCAQAGIVSGVGDSKFDPAGELTALQFGKMLLVELGYDAKVEGMVGTDWAINTSKLMAKVELMDGISGSVNQVLTREKAAQMCLNALEAPMVTYENKGSSVTVNGAEINFGASTAKYETSTIAKDQNISKEKLTSGEYTVELGEKLYKDLKKNSTTDAFERPATEWKLKAEKIGTYADAADATYTKNTKISDIYADLGLSDGISKTKVTEYVDGEKQGAFTQDFVKGNRAEIGGKGTLLNVYYDDDAETITLVEIKTYVGQISAAYKATSTKDAYVKVKTNENFTNPGETVGDFDTDVFAKDDIVAYTFSKKDGEHSIQSMSALEKVTGAMSAYTTTGSVTVGGTKYDANATSKAKIVNFAQTVDKGTDVTVYLDANGYALYIDADTSKEYAVVLDYEAGARLDADRAKLLFTDGTTKKVDIDELYDYSGSGNVKTLVTSINTSSNVDYQLDVYDIVSYTINSDGEYTLTLVADAVESIKTADASTTKNLMKNGVAAIDLIENDKAGVAKQDTVRYADGETVVLAMNKKSGQKVTYSAYEGIANAPTATVKNVATKVAVYQDADDTAATVIFILNDDNVTMSSSNKDVVFVKGNGDGVSYTKDLGYFYEYTAYVNGEKTTIKTDSTLRITAKSLVYGPQYNDKGILTGFDYADGISKTDASGNETNSAYNHGGTFVDYMVGTKAPVKGVIALGSTPTSYAYTKDCNAYMFDVEGDLSNIDITSIADDTNDQVWFKLDDDGLITDIYVQVIDENKVVDAGNGSKVTNATLTKADDNKLTISWTLADTCFDNHKAEVKVYQVVDGKSYAFTSVTHDSTMGANCALTAPKAITQTGSYYAVITITDKANNTVCDTVTTETMNFAV